MPTLLKGFTYDGVRLKDGETVQAGERVEVVLTLEAKDDLEYLVVEDLKAAGLEAVQLTSGDNLAARELTREEVEKRRARIWAALVSNPRRPGIPDRSSVSTRN